MGAEPLPHQLGRYLIEARLGRGSMGDVFRARDPRSGQVVAIKTLSIARAAAGEADDALRERFVREARAATTLAHPGILRALEAGVDGGLAWIALEHVSGNTLEAHAAPTALLPPPVAVIATARVADALAHAHRLGIVHRDVKPANVLVDLPADRVLLADFGIAAIGGGERTQTGVLLGTPAYMAPELLAGQRPDARCDLYALGVVLFQLLTGELPHRANSLGALMRAVAGDPAPDIRERRADLPGVLAEAVALALQKNPAHRIADAAAWADDLRTIAAMADSTFSATLSPRAPDSGGGQVGGFGNP